MTDRIRTLFKEFKKTPFPTLGKTLGEFSLYDSLVAGTVTSFLAGVELGSDAIPAPDTDTDETLRLLRKKPTPTPEEQELVRYADLLEQLRQAITQALKAH